MTKQEIENGLTQFHGTDEYHSHWTRQLVMTDGVKWLADNAGAHWLIDMIASYQPDSRVRNNASLQSIQFWELRVNEDDGTAVLSVVEDEGVPPALTQHIPFTDFPLPSIDIWVEKGYYTDATGAERSGFVAMLKSER